MEIRLSKVISTEKDKKSRHNARTSQYHHTCEKQQLFNGMHKVYQPKSEDGELFPPESVRVQANVAEYLETIGKSLSEIMDVVATKDYGNTIAKADLVIEGTDINIKDVPPTFFLFIEKQMNDMYKFVSKLPELDPAESWAKDEDSGLFKSEIRKTHRTHKIQKPIVLYDATPEHPAQTQLVTSDEIIGYWDTMKISGAIPATRKKILLDRIIKVMEAVVQAREEANSTAVKDVKGIGASIMGYLFA